MLISPKLAKVFGAALVAASATACLAAGNPWNGTWKLNAAQSKMTGEVETVAISPDGQWTVKSSGVSFSFACDGQSYPLIGGRSMVCSRTGTQQVNGIISVNGAEFSHMKRTLSTDGREQVVLITGKTPDGKAFEDSETYKKVSGGSGWNGEWENTRIKESQPGIAVVQAAGDSITFSYPRTKMTLTAKLDGTPTTEQGQLAKTGSTVSLTGDGPLSIREVDTLNGTVTEHDTLSVTPDGKIMTVEVLRTGGQQKQVYVYNKQ